MTLDPTEFGILSAAESYGKAAGLFSEVATVESHLRFEAALARAEARAGVIPAEAVPAIEAACRLDRLDLNRLRDEAAVVGYPIVPLVRQLADAAGDAGRWVHWGATTQDVMDTGLMLQARAGVDLTLGRLDALCTALGGLVGQHRETVLVGRSKIQHAAPITFGYKAAVWLSQIDRCRQRLKRVRQEDLCLQFGGAVGTLAALGGEGLRVRALLADELALREPVISWHVARDGLAVLVHTLALVNASLGKVGVDIAQMMATEVDEVREPFHPGRGTSSTMPQKRNPVLSEALISSAKAARESASLMLDAVVQDHERATTVGHLELRAVARAVALAAGAADTAVTLLGGLEVDASRMRRNLRTTNGLVMAEAVMMALAPELGRDKAHTLVHEACHTASADGRTLASVLVAQYGLSEATITAALKPEGYLGNAREMAGAVLRAVRETEGS